MSYGLTLGKITMMDKADNKIQPNTLSQPTTENDFDFATPTPHWACEECGHKSFTKPMPKDRARFYANKVDIRCPLCRSPGYKPVGW